jgi:UDP-galactopyranose mutase
MEVFIIGAGIWGAVMAERIVSVMKQPVTIIDRRGHMGGNCYSSQDEETGIECHRYGSHIFHTSLPQVWEYLSRFCEFTSYRHKVLITHGGKVYAMPINLFSINALYDKNFTPSEAKAFLAAEIARDHIEQPANLEEKTVSLIGRPLYDAFIKNYTYKQWGRAPKELPAAIINRLPIRTCYNMDYFNDTWQGIPKDGYFNLFKIMLTHPNITVRLNCAYAEIQHEIPADAVIIYTGMPDALFNYKYGELEWRSLRFEWQTLPLRDFQGTAVMNYADMDTPYTRIHEFKHYHPERNRPFNLEKTIICREYPANYHKGCEAYYPVNDERNDTLYTRYAEEASKHPKLILGGRLGAYRYWDMDKAVANALHVFETRIRPTEVLV